MSTGTTTNHNIDYQMQEQFQEGIIKRSRVPDHYLIDTRIDCLEYEEEHLADELEDYLIETLIQDIFYTQNYIMRVAALQQLNSWIDKTKIKRIFSIIAKNEKNLEMKKFASQLLGVDMQ